MENTLVFVGYYFDKATYEQDSGEFVHVKYNMAVAYLLVALAYFVVILVLMVN